MGFRRATSLLVGWALVAPAAIAQDGLAESGSVSTMGEQVEQQVGGSDDRASYRKAIARYSQRLDEFRGEVQEIVDSAERDEREELLKGFSVTQDQLTQKAKQRRTLAIGRFEGFRKKYPDAEYTPHVLYRLAELYFEKAEEEFLDELEEYTRLEIMAADNPEMEEPDSPTKDYDLPIGLYEEIVANFPDYEFIDGALYMLGFCYSEDNTRQFDEAKAVAALQRLVVEYPQSPATVDASLRLGERYFEGRQLGKAIENFRRVVSVGADGTQYDDGLYMLAWSHYRLGERETALKYFTMLLDWDRETFLESGEASDYPKEAIAYMALTFSEIAIDFDGHPLETARNWFDKIGPREWELDVYQALSDKLEEYDRPSWALQTLVEIQKRWPLDAGNPDRQKHVAWLYKNKLPEEGASAPARALAHLADTYGEGSPWWEANRSNPDALAAARKHIQESLSEVAQELHIRAREKEKLEGRTAAVKMAYSEAADRYRNYLESDPFVSDQEKNQWYLADTLFNAGRYPEAIVEYTSLAAKDGHPYRDGARYHTVKSWEKILINAYQKHNVRPADAVRERVVLASNGNERSVYWLVEAHEAYVAAADDIRSDQFEDIPENAGYIAALETDRVPLHYTPAQILHEYGRFEDSRPRLEEIIDLFPGSDEAAFSANLLVNSYLEEGDLENVRGLLARFSEQDLGGDPAAIAERQDKFRQQLEQTVYQLAGRLKEDGKLIPSANAFLAFTEEFPDSDLVDEALYSSAVYYNNAGKVTRANALYEDFINRYPDHEDAEGLTFDIAKNSADVLDFEKALDYYGRILKYFGDGEYADGALLNSAQLKVGLGDHRGAATALEDYVRRFPEDENLEGYLWLAGQQWELEGDRDALRFYGRYLKQRRGVHPGHTLEALNWIAAHYEETGSRKAEKAWIELVETCNTFLVEGREVRRRGRHLAARVLFKELLADLEAFKEITYPDASKMSFVTAFNELNVSKMEELDALSERATHIFQTYSDPATTMGAFYVVGAAQLAFAELYFNAPTPTMLNDRQAERFRGGLVTGATPQEEKALSSLKNVLKWSETLKESSEWVDKSVVLLNALRPKEYPLEKQEIRGIGDSNFVPVAGPRSEPLPQGEAE
jgi:TolA-binding protein